MSNGNINECPDPDFPCRPLPSASNLSLLSLPPKSMSVPSGPQVNAAHELPCLRDVKENTLIRLGDLVLLRHGPCANTRIPVDLVQG